MVYEPFTSLISLSDNIFPVHFAIVHGKVITCVELNHFAIVQGEVIVYRHCLNQGKVKINSPCTPENSPLKCLLVGVIMSVLCYIKSFFAFRMLYVELLANRYACHGKINNP